MSSKTKTEIIQNLIANIKLINSSVDTSTGTVTRDVIIDAISTEISDLYTEIESLKELSSLVYAADMDEEDMDNLAYNWGITRLDASSATGRVTFQTVTKPTTTTTIPSGTTVKTQETSGTSYSFSTTEAVVLDTNTLLNSSTGYYEVTAAIQANSTGAAYNVSANSITVLGSPISGVDYVNNALATSGGTDSESNTAMVNRILAHIQGIAVGTSGGYKSLALTISGVEDALAVGPNDTEMYRDVYGGSVDLYLMGQTLASYEEDITYGTGEDEYELTTRPVTSVASITGLTMASGSLHTFVQDTDYEFTQDTSQVYGYSTQSSDKITWIGSTPYNGSDFTVLYNYDSTVRDVQDLVDDADNKVVTADVVVKYAASVNILIEVSVSKLSGYEASEVESDCETALTTWINGKGLGEDLEYSDVVDVLYDASDGVDSVTIPLTYFYRTDDPKAEGAIQNISIAKNEYPTAYSVTVNIT